MDIDSSKRRTKGNLLPSLSARDFEKVTTVSHFDATHEQPSAESQKQTAIHRGLHLLHCWKNKQEQDAVANPVADNVREQKMDFSQRVSAQIHPFFQWNTCYHLYTRNSLAFWGGGGIRFANGWQLCLEGGVMVLNVTGRVALCTKIRVGGFGSETPYSYFAMRAYVASHVYPE